jgi:hypothetical protein
MGLGFASRRGRLLAPVGAARAAGRGRAGLGPRRPDSGLWPLVGLLVGGFELRLDDDLVGFLDDREVLEDGEVEQASLGLGRDVVRPLVRVYQQEGFVECGHDVVDLVLGGLCPLLDLGLLGGDAGLFGAQGL